MAESDNKKIFDFLSDFVAIENIFLIKNSTHIFFEEKQ
jgi:hypothetical protein